MRHLITLQDWSADEIDGILLRARDIKTQPERFAEALKQKTLFMFFEKPSLRTRVSFETGMTQMGGHAIAYDGSRSPLGAGKETPSDTVRTVSRYVDIIIARLFEHSAVIEMAEHATVPVINALTNFSHPCQVLADFSTILEKKGGLEGKTLAFLGDGNNNMTHSLLYGCSRKGINIRVGCPEGADFSPLESVVEEARKSGEASGAEVVVTHDAKAAADGADVIYTDSWMSYHIPEHQLGERVEKFTPFQVNDELMDCAAPDAIFMNCLPALRGYEQTAEVIDGPQSVVWDQAENRLHVQKSIMLELLGVR
ncbi:MAG: ornithine carbamoyltransferase [Verrucomicrobiota bacterium]